MTTKNAAHWEGFIKAARDHGLDNIEIIGLYTVNTGGGTEDDALFFDILEKTAADKSDLQMIQQMITKSSDCHSECPSTPMQDAGAKEDKTLDLMRDTRAIQGGEGQGTPIQNDELKEDATLDLLQEIQNVQFTGSPTPEEDEDMRNRGAGTDKKSQAFQLGFNEIMRKAAGGQFDAGDLAMLSSMSRGGGMPLGIGSGVHEMGQGMRDMALASLAEKDPQSAILARGRLAGESQVGALGPLEGWIPGALAGATLGGGLGALGGGLSGGTPAALGVGAAGALGGGVLGGTLQRALLEEQIRSDAYKKALQQYNQG